MPQVSLNKERHVYVLEDGREVYTSVTGVLKKAGLYAQYIPNAEYHMSLGKTRHETIEYYEDGSLDMDTLDGRLKPYLDSYIKFRDDSSDWQVRLAEKSLYHPEHDYAGTLDIFTTTGCLLDIKGPSNDPTPSQLQLGALWGLLQINGYDCASAGTVHLQKDGSIAIIKNPMTRQLLEEAYDAFITILKETRE